MASRRKQLNVVAALDSHEGFARAVEESTRFLVVVDIHQAWTGPCTVMEPIYRKAMIELDRADERLKFYTVSGIGGYLSLCRKSIIILQDPGIIITAARERDLRPFNNTLLSLASKHTPLLSLTQTFLSPPPPSLPSLFLLQIDESKLLPAQRAGLPISDSCRPLFVVYKVRIR